MWWRELADRGSLTKGDEGDPQQRKTKVSVQPARQITKLSKRLARDQSVSAEALLPQGICGDMAGVVIVANRYALQVMKSGLRREWQVHGYVVQEHEQNRDSAKHTHVGRNSGDSLIIVLVSITLTSRDIRPLCPGRKN